MTSTRLLAAALLAAASSIAAAQGMDGPDVAPTDAATPALTAPAAPPEPTGPQRKGWEKSTFQIGAEIGTFRTVADNWDDDSIPTYDLDVTFKAVRMGVVEDHLEWYALLGVADATPSPAALPETPGMFFLELGVRGGGGVLLEIPEVDLQLGWTGPAAYYRLMYGEADDLPTSLDTFSRYILSLGATAGGLRATLGGFAYAELRLLGAAIFLEQVESDGSSLNPPSGETFGFHAGLDPRLSVGLMF